MPEVTEEQAARLRFRKIPDRPTVTMTARTKDLWDELEAEANQFPMGDSHYVSVMNRLVALKEEIENANKDELAFLDDPAQVGSLTSTYRHDGTVVQRNSLGQVREIKPTEETRRAMAAEEERLEQPVGRDDNAGVDATLSLLKSDFDRALESYTKLNAKDRHKVLMQASSEDADQLFDALLTRTGSRG